MTYKNFFEEWHDDKDYIVCHTSGSTGQPKIIKLSKASMKASALRTIKFFHLSSDSYLYSCISPEYIGGKMMAVRADILNADLGYESPSNQPLNNYKGQSVIDLLAVVPSQLNYIIDNLDKIPYIENIIVGGAPVNNSLNDKILKSKLNVYETYGMTETASHIALKKIDGKSAFFYPLPGISILLNEEGRLIIEINDLNINNDAGSQNQKHILTNDLAELDGKGGFRIIGRYDNVINTGGIKVVPEEMENILEKSFHCEILITSVPDTFWGEKILMVIDDSKNILSDEFIMQRCRELLPKYCIPKIIMHRKLDKTPNGKKKRK